MADPATLVSLLVSGWSAFAGSVVGQAIIGGYFSNATDRAICQLGRSLRDRVAGLQGLPESHDLAQAIRLAQMQALERVIRCFRESHRQEWEAGLGDPHLTFFDRALGFCGPFGTGRRIEPDQALEITASVERTFEGLLAEPAPGSPSGSRTGLLASLAENAVLEELRGALDGQELPAGFEREYRLGSGQGRHRFLDVFGFYFAEQIKEKPRVRHVLTTGQLARIEGLAFDGTEMLARMLEQFDALGRNLAAIEATTTRTEQNLDSGVQAILAAVSAERGIPLVALRAILAAFGEAAQTLDLADMEARLRIKADEHLALTSRLRKLSNDDPAVQRLRQQASELIERADVSTADRALAEAARIDMEAIEEQQANVDRRRRSAAATYADRAATARLSRAYRDEAQHYAAAARVLADIDPQETWRYLLAQADALKTLGDELGDNAALSEAICLYGTGVLPRAPRDHMPLEWAETQTQLGIALRMLGDRESGTENLELAVNTLRAALQERRRDRVPLKWAVTQTNLGSALIKLGERRRQAFLLAEAVQVLTDALEECAREPFPFDWATAQANLASALFILGARKPI